MTISNTAQSDSEYLLQRNDLDINTLRSILGPEVKTIAVVSPASMPDATAVRNTIKIMEKAGYKVKLAEHAINDNPELKRQELNVRIADFMKAWNDPEVDMIYCARGGSGAFELIQQLDWKTMRDTRPNMKLQGFSDITCILCAMLSTDTGEPHAGPTFRSLLGLSEDSLQQMKAVYAKKNVPPFQLKPLRAGDCSGKPIAGHLERLQRLQNSPFCPDSTGHILFIECVGKNMEDLQQYMQVLFDKGFLAKASGLVFCHFTRCAPDKDILTWQKDVASRLNIPVYYGYPFGHETRNYTIDLKSTAVIKDNILSFQF